MWCVVSECYSYTQSDHLSQSGLCGELCAGSGGLRSPVPAQADQLLPLASVLGQDWDGNTRSFVICTLHLILFGWFNNEMSRPSNMHGSNEKCLHIAYCKTWGEISCARHKQRWEDSIKTYVKKYVVKMWASPLMCFYEHDDEPQVPINI